MFKDYDDKMMREYGAKSTRRRKKDNRLDGKADKPRKPSKTH